MSKHRRPTARLATALNLSDLTLFVQTRALVLETAPEAIAELEKAAGLSKLEAMQYFLHFYEWPPETKKFLAGNTAGPEQKQETVKILLAQTLGLPLLQALPEA